MRLGMLLRFHVPRRNHVAPIFERLKDSNTVLRARQHPAFGAVLLGLDPGTIASRHQP